MAAVVWKQQRRRAADRAERNHSLFPARPGDLPCGGGRSRAARSRQRAQGHPPTNDRTPCRGCRGRAAARGVFPRDVDAARWPAHRRDALASSGPPGGQRAAATWARVDSHDGGCLRTRRRPGGDRRAPRYPRRTRSLPCPPTPIEDTASQCSRTGRSRAARITPPSPRRTRVTR
jgi:hypothetical protein